MAILSTDKSCHGIGTGRGAGGSEITGQSHVGSGAQCQAGRHGDN